jgi:hypothetical protein
LRWASDPLGPFLGIALLFVRMRPTFANEELIRNKTPEDIHKEATGGYRLLIWYERFFLWFKAIVEDLAQHTLVTLFSVALVILFVVTLVGYGVAIYAVQSKPNQAFGNLDPSLARCLVYSLSVEVTSPISDVTLKEDVAYLLYGCELTNTFLMLTLFFAMFSAAISFHGKRRAKQILASLNDSQKWFASERQRLIDLANREGNAPPGPLSPPPT